MDKISRGAAINRGTETFVEITFYYILLLSITAYDLRNRYRESGKQQVRLGEVEKEYKSLDERYDTLMENVQGSEQPGAQNSARIVELQTKVHSLKNRIAQIENYI